MKSLGVGYREEAMSDVTGNLNWMTILIRNRMSTTLKNLDCNNFGILLAFSISASVCVCVCVWWKGLTRGSCHCQSNFSRPCMRSRQETSEPGDVILPEFKDGREGNVCNRIRSRPALSSSSSFGGTRLLYSPRKSIRAFTSLCFASFWGVARSETIVRH